MRNSSTTISKADKASLYFVAWMWSFNVWPFFLSVVRRIPVLSIFTGSIVPIISIVLALFAISYNKNKLKSNDIVFCVVVIIVYLLHMVLFPQNIGYLQAIGPYFFYTCFPYFIVGLFINFEKQKFALEYVSVAVIFLTILYQYVFKFLLGENVVDASHGDDMATAYRFLPHMLLLLYSILEKFGVLRAFFVIIAFIMISGTGNRGALLMIALFLILYFLLLKQYKHQVLSRVFIVIVGISAISFLPTFARFMSETLLSFNIGLSDRAFQFYLEGDIAYDNGRNSIRQTLLFKLGEAPLWGYGLCGDRVLIGLWSHNLLLELWVSFGYLFGSILFVSLVVVIIQGYLKCNTINEKGMLLVLFLLGFAVLFVSNTFLSNRFFWLLLGYCICLRRKPMISINNSLSN